METEKHINRIKTFAQTYTPKEVAELMTAHARRGNQSGLQCEISDSGNLLFRFFVPEPTRSDRQTVTKGDYAIGFYWKRPLLVFAQWFVGTDLAGDCPMLGTLYKDDREVGGNFVVDYGLFSLARRCLTAHRLNTYMPYGGAPNLTTFLNDCLAQQRETGTTLAEMARLYQAFCADHADSIAAFRACQQTAYFGMPEQGVGTV